MLSALLTLLLILAFFGGSTIAFAQTQTGTTKAKPTQNLAQIAANNTNLTTLVRLLNEADLLRVLNLSDNKTLFAPTNAAFAKMDSITLADIENNPTALKQLLLYHMIPARVSAINFTGNGSLNTWGGNKLPYTVNIVTGIRVDNATVTTYDINATNGVMHIIDNVMIPPPKETVDEGLFGLPGFEVMFCGAALVVAAYLALWLRK